MSIADSQPLMRAAYYERKGAAREVLQIGELPIPKPGLGEVRVRVAVSSINPSDTKGRSVWRSQTEMPFPRIIPTRTAQVSSTQSARMLGLARR